MAVIFVDVEDRSLLEKRRPDSRILTSLQELASHLEAEGDAREV